MSENFFRALLNFIYEITFSWDHIELESWVVNTFYIDFYFNTHQNADYNGFLISQ